MLGRARGRQLLAVEVGGSMKLTAGTMMHCSVALRPCSMRVRSTAQACFSITLSPVLVAL